MLVFFNFLDSLSTFIFCVDLNKIHVREYVSALYEVRQMVEGNQSTTRFDTYGFDISPTTLIKEMSKLGDIIKMAT